VTAIGRDQDPQTRGGPDDFGVYQSGGVRSIDRARLAAIAPEYAREAVELATAPTLPSGTRDVILDGGVLSLQLHESVGHPLELDRAARLGGKLLGTSWVTPADVGKAALRERAAEHLRRQRDAARVGDGRLRRRGDCTTARPADRERDSAGVPSSRDTAAQTGLPLTASSRAQDWASIPIVRMTNIALAPHEGTLASIIAETADGVLVSGMTSWSIDDHRLNFQFGPQIAYDIKNGKRGKIFKRPTYTGVTPSSGDRWTASAVHPSTAFAAR